MKKVFKAIGISYPEPRFDCRYALRLVEKSLFETERGGFDCGKCRVTHHGF